MHSDKEAEILCELLADLRAAFYKKKASAAVEAARRAYMRAAHAMNNLESK